MRPRPSSSPRRPASRPGASSATPCPGASTTGWIEALLGWDDARPPSGRGPCATAGKRPGATRCACRRSSATCPSTRRPTPTGGLPRASRSRTSRRGERAPSRRGRDPGARSERLAVFAELDEPSEASVPAAARAPGGRAPDPARRAARRPRRPPPPAARRGPRVLRRASRRGDLGARPRFGRHAARPSRRSWTRSGTCASRRPCARRSTRSGARPRATSSARPAASPGGRRARPRGRAPSTS